jgi:type IV secretion system protein VirB4
VTNSRHRDIVIDQCITKLFGPNSEAESASSQQLYLAMGLNDQEIAALRWAPPKSHYLYHGPLGRSVFSLGLGRAALSFVGVSGPEHVRAVQACADRYGPTWPAEWLQQRRCAEEAAWWLADYERRNGKEEQYATLFSLPPAHGSNGAHPSMLQ